MTDREKTWTALEISMATGIPRKMITARLGAAKKRGEIPPPAVQGRYNYEAVKLILRKRASGRTKPDPNAVNYLKSKLTNDGFPIARDGK